MPSNKRPVWLLSMDSDQFYAAPTTTGGLKAWYQQYGVRAADTDIRLVHFRDADEIVIWQQNELPQLLAEAQEAASLGLQPVVGLSVYTWNAAEFLELSHTLKQACADLLIVAGGPHVQEAQEYLGIEPVDLIVLGEAEITFQLWLDCHSPAQWSQVDGIAFMEDGVLLETPERPRMRELDQIPSALDVVALCNEQGEPLYESISYETSRGCPFKCAFCEWGTGAIGSKMHQFSMARIERDWRKIVASGISNIWLADSNFGALKDDLAKAELICELKQNTGLPRTFATSWSKKHSPRVQTIVLMLHNNGLLPHYQLALQTLTPLALELSNRKNMAANKYEPIAREMAQAGVPIAAELIWGLPGDNLADFEANLDQLLATFPNINIFGYTLLPGTEFYERREEYQIDAIPVAGYGKAKGEYVVGCHTFGREEGIEGYFMITAHIILNHGHIMPLTIRYLAMQPDVPATPLLRAVLRALLEAFAPELEPLDIDDKMSVYECRSKVYLLLLAQMDKTFEVISFTVHDWLSRHDADNDVIARTNRILSLDKIYCPRSGQSHQLSQELDFNAHDVTRALEILEIPADEAFVEQPTSVLVNHPGGVGDVLKDPDGGSWIRGQLAPLATELIASTA
ncbi:MAG: radical SAM protein [Pseudomonadales bacterium]